MFSFLPLRTQKTKNSKKKNHHFAEDTNADRTRAA
jgi:hypothetical protein